MNKNNRVKWWIDAILFLGFILACTMDLTGLELHQWLGIFLGVLAGYHLLTHLDWLNAVAERFFGKTRARSRVYLVLDLVILAGFLLIIGSGLLMSTWLQLPLANYTFWVAIHITVTTVTLLAVAIKMLLHWRWLATCLRRRTPCPTESILPGTLPRTGASTVSRRQFLGVLGVVGAGTALATYHALRGLNVLTAPLSEVSAQDLPAQPLPEVPPAVDVNNALPVPTATIDPLPAVLPTAADPLPTAVPTAVVLPTACVVRCPNGCSYPGRCRRYVDRNGNNRCDWGECL